MYACFFSALLDVWLAARAQRWDTVTLRHSVAHVSASCLSLRPNSAPSMDVSHRVAFHVFNPSGLGISSDGLYACVPCQLSRSVQALHGRITRLCGLEGPRFGICRCTQRMAVARGVGHPVRVLLSYNLVRVYEVPSYISLCLVHVHLTTDSSFPPGMITRAACHRGGTLSIGAFASA